MSYEADRKSYSKNKNRSDFRYTVFNLFVSRCLQPYLRYTDNIFCNVSDLPLGRSACYLEVDARKTLH